MGLDRENLGPAVQLSVEDDETVESITTFGEHSEETLTPRNQSSTMTSKESPAGIDLDLEAQIRLRAQIIQPSTKDRQTLMFEMARELGFDDVLVWIFGVFPVSD